jgi:signal transduction histidine kinase/CheY-like chemotaxis protein/HPt (histidine-containing phosphotransfer) domain-containing protein
MRDAPDLPPAPNRPSLGHAAIDAAAAAEPRRALQRLILLGGILVIGLLWLGALHQISAERVRALQQAEHDATNLALVFDEKVRRSFSGLDQALLVLKGEYESDRRGFSVARWRDRLPVLAELATGLGQIGPDGKLIATLEGTADRALDFADRDYFVAHALSDDGRLVVGRPVTGRLSGRAAITLSRRVNGPDGGFAGVLVLGVDPQQLARVRNEIALGRDGVVLLAGLDGVVRAQSGGPPAPIGQDLSAGSLFASVRTEAAGTWTGDAVGDGIHRIWAFRHIPEFPLVSLVGISRDETLGDLASRERSMLLVTALISLALLFLLGLLVIEINRRQTREEELRRERRGLEEANIGLGAAKRLADDKTALLEATLVNMSDGISVFDRELRLVTWNQQFIELVGVDQGVLKPGVSYEAILRVQAISGEFGQVDVEEEVKKRMERVRQGQFVQLERTRADGRTVEMRRRYLPDGGFVTLYSDITDRKRAEIEMKKSRELAEAASAAKSAFVAVVSHEIRTPMNAVLGTLGLLADSPLDAEQRQYVDTARSSAEALLAIINDILDLSKIEAGKLELEPSDFALQPLVTGAIDLFRASAKEKAIALSWGVAQDLPAALFSDAGRLRQVLLNLLSNAVKFSHPGDVVLTVTRDLSSGRGPMIRFAVADSGPGIPADQREKLFQPFSQLQAPDRRNTGGTGLGLAICRRLVELFGGRIGVADRPAGGSVFWFTIPLSPARGRAEPDAAQLPRAPTRARVLLVEDSPANQLVAATWLRRAGHRVDVAGNGFEAVAAMSERPYDIVFMDVFMPEMDGLEATRRIRALAGQAGITPIIALTANVMAGDRERFLEAGMNGLLPKPVTVRMLMDALARFAGTPAPAPAPAAPSPRAGASPEAAAGRTAAMQKLPAAPLPVAATPLPTTPDIDEAAFQALARGLPADTVAMLIETCAGELQSRYPRLVAAAAAADARTLVMEAHAIAGGAANYGLARLAQHARAIEQAGHEGEVDRARPLVDALAPVLTAGVAALQTKRPVPAAAK